MDPGFHTATSNIFPPYSKLLVLRLWLKDGYSSMTGSLLDTQKLGSTLDPWNLNVNFKHSKRIYVHIKTWEALG